MQERRLSFDCIYSSEKYNGQNIWKSPSAMRVVYSDASGTGYGGYVVEHGCHVAHGQWDAYKMEKSSSGQSIRVNSSKVREPQSEVVHR